MFHISDCKKYTRCPRIFVNSKKEGKVEYNSFVRVDKHILRYAMEKLHLSTYFEGHTGDKAQCALEAMQTNEWLVNARFEADLLRVKVPFLHQHDDGWDIYFLFAGIYPRANDLQLYTDTVWVLQQNNIQVKDMYVIHLNVGYVRGKELDIDQLFLITDKLYNNNNNPTISIRDEVQKHLQDLRPLLNEMAHCSEETLPPPVRRPLCAGRVKCQYYNRCFAEELEQPDNSILTLIAAQHRYDMQKENILYLKDADVERIEGSKQQYAQIMADKNGGLFVDEIALKNWLGKIEYPISFLDFEWERFAIPPYEGMKPYDVLPFEYALYVLQADGTYEKHIYLNVHDDRRDMAESLIRHIPNRGSVMAYNAIGAESVRIREFAEMFEDLRDDLMHIHDRMVDLQEPFLSGSVYDTRMKGQWSLKVIMSMMDDPGYKSLYIAQGMEAVFQWRHLDFEEEISAEEKDKIIEDLKKYCGMDSYAMIVVYHWLKKVNENAFAQDRG